MSSISRQQMLKEPLPIYRIVHSSGEHIVDDFQLACKLVSERPGARIYRVDTSSWRPAEYFRPT